MDKTVVTMINLSSLAAGSTSSLSDCTALDLSRTISLFLEVEATFDASATEGLTIKWYTSRDNTNWSTVEWLSDDINVSPGNTVLVPLVPIDPAPMYLKATITNNDSSYAVTNVKLYATQTEL